MTKTEMEDGVVLGCDDFPKAPLCCESCHEDANEYGMELMTIEADDGRVLARVCCAVYEVAIARLQPHDQD